MKSNVTRMLRMLSRLALGLMLLVGLVSAQQPSNGNKPNSGSATSGEGESAGNYNIISSIEFGWRAIDVSGNENKYRSDLNYKAGPRVFDSSFLMKSKDGKGGWIDTLLVTTTGWGADPYGQVRISAEQSKWYKFMGSYRRFKYFRAVNNFANPNWIFTFPTFVVPPNPVVGQHNSNTKTYFGDFDLTILPKNETIRFNIGFSPERFSGPMTTNYHIGGNEFQLPNQVRSRAYDFRVGADGKVGPVDWSFLQGFRRFRDDSFIATGAVPGINPNPLTADFTRFNRNDPLRGSVNYTRFSAHTFLAKKLDITGRIVYSSATSNSPFIENFAAVNWNTRVQGAPNSGPYAVPNVLNQGIYSYQGEAKRPNTLADFGVTFLATDKLRLSNTFRVETYQINGSNIYNSSFLISRNGVPAPPLRNTNFSDFEITKYRKYQDIVEGDYQFNDRYAIHFGYRYGNRWLEKTIGGYTIGTGPYTTPAGPATVIEQEENTTNAFFGGFKFRPYKNWSLYFDAEHGTADNIFTRVGNYDYTNVRVKSRYSVNRKFSFFLAAIIRNNANPSAIDGVSLEDFGVTVKSRVFSSTFDWTPSSRFSMNGGYNYNWVNDNAVINYRYATQTGPTTLTTVVHYFGRSLYFQRNNYFFVDTVTELHRRATLYLSYRINKDNGQGNRLADPAFAGPAYTPPPPPPPAAAPPPGVIGGTLVTSYPMSFQGPEARLTFRINRRFDWNVGYQYYNYNESLLASPWPQNYHAHLPYTSVRIYFGRGE